MEGPVLLGGSLGKILHVKKSKKYLFQEYTRPISYSGVYILRSITIRAASSPSARKVLIVHYIETAFQAPHLRGSNDTSSLYGMISNRSRHRLSGTHTVKVGTCSSTYVHHMERRRGRVIKDRTRRLQIKHDVLTYSLSSTRYFSWSPLQAGVLLAIVCLAFANLVQHIDASVIVL